MARALELARRGPSGEFPRVGCVVIDAGGLVVGEGWHGGVGTPHAAAVAVAVPAYAPRAPLRWSRSSRAPTPAERVRAPRR